MDVTNNLNESTTLPGMACIYPPLWMADHINNPAGTLWQPYWTIKNQAATLWYHPLLHEYQMRFYNWQ
jgi:FtsP/CotA-like multicopper oxidase with cupredoxin domain